jgi:uncharacterized protein (TIGR03435 family)
MWKRSRFSWPLLAVFAVGAQTQAPAPLSFDVATVKPSTQPWLQIVPQRSGGRFNWTTDLHYLIGYAYQLPLSRLAGTVPGSANLYEVVATTDSSATDEQIRRMLQTLLAERFKLAVHPEMKEADGYALKAGKSGPKILEAKEEGPPPPMPAWMGKQVAEASLDGRVVAMAPSAGVVAITGRRVTMAQLAAALERQMGAFVTDETGLSGKYYLGFQFAKQDHPPEADLPTIFPALQDLGLKLEKRKGPVEVLVIDHVEKTPLEN